jgi:hypothetical protein
MPSGLVKNPQMSIAGVDLWVNDVVWLDNNIVYPMFDESHKMHGVVLARGIKGKNVLIAT